MMVLTLSYCGRIDESIESRDAAVTHGDDIHSGDLRPLIRFAKTPSLTPDIVESLQRANSRKHEVGEHDCIAAQRPGLRLHVQRSVEAAAAKLRAEDLDVHPVELDLNRRETIEAAASIIKAHVQRLDILINNAAIVDPADGLPSTVVLSVVQRVMETNFFGTLSVTQAMLPLLRESPAPRIVNVSSGLGSLVMNGDPAWSFAGAKLLGYNTSKAALNMLAIQLAYEFRNTPMKVNSANPGYTATDMNGNQGNQTLEEGAAEPVRLALLTSDGPTGGFLETAGPYPW